MNELDAAGISDPQLRASFTECKRLNSLHGKTYYLATLLLPPAKRPYVHALYGFADSIEVEHMTTPLDWQSQGMEQGAPFASAHTFFQTGPFRPRNIAKGFENVVFAGSGTQPGVGVPMVLISGRLAAERIVGPVK